MFPELSPSRDPYQSGLIAYLVRKSERELDLVRGNVGVASSCQGSGKGCGTSPDGCTSDTEGVHD